MAAKNIKLNAEETLGHVSKIAATMAEVSVPGPVPPPAPAASPIDAALNTVVLAAAEKAEASSATLSKRGTDHNATSLRAVSSMQTQEEENTYAITEIQPQAQQSGTTAL
ncbi:hypothetical protein [Mycobacterium sp. ITM-2016-00318]|uniref:hypothetical protein n=1 Tax=Mycobacterium sp. ITM-2016-00318 TaxID=2099693 RepID=UPI000CF9216C|nr:hypothetical protein [Mycobacterium sp. ITM-2016-00318]WNG92478.1 hypothetical protein C6A82_024285 [Mycobacterium sp. ITM-2016-00318]